MPTRGTTMVEKPKHVVSFEAHKFELRAAVVMTAAFSLPTGFIAHALWFWATGTVCMP